VTVDRLRIVFMGSPEFAVPSLRAVSTIEDVVAVVTQPDKPAGRGQKLVEPAVKRYAVERGLPVLQPAKARDPGFLEQLRALAPDVAVVVAYGKILPQAVLDVPRLGCLNVHGSLLPKYRGAAPVQWAVIDGEPETGVTIMQLDAGMDTGPMLLWCAVRIGDDETSGKLAERLAGIGAELMAVALGRLKAGALPPTPQDDAAATLAPMLKKELGNLDFTWPAGRLRNLVRGVDPWPGAYTFLDGELLKVWGARLAPGRGQPGEVLGVEPEGLVVACGEGALSLAELQLDGRKRVPAEAFVA
jgi:methionyl-tRNA formyltransferase